MITRHVPSSHRTRAGITLTEILISILIMGIGLISLATLFPLGIIRLRSAARDTRGALLGESAVGEIMTRNLFASSSFTNNVSNPWYGPVGYGYGVNAGSYNPWVLDPGLYGSDPVAPNNGVSRFGVGGPGLPVCYDPFFRAFATNPSGPPDLNVTTTPGVYSGATWGEARFARGVFLGTNMGADGLQRVTNFDMTFPDRVTFGATSIASPPTLAQNATNLFAYNRMLDTVASIFASQDDVLMYSPDATQQVAATGQIASTLIPDRSGAIGAAGTVTRDFSYTWFFTGQQSDSTNADQFDGSIVVCHNRPLTIEPIANGTTSYAAAGESVVHAIWGYGGKIAPIPGLGTQAAGYFAGGDRSVLLYWPASMTDPEVRVGNWIADVTYERLQVNSYAHNLTARTIANAVETLQGAPKFLPIPDFPVYEPQRCLWYQIVKRSEISDSKIGATSYRIQTVQVGGSLRAKTLVTSAGVPIAQEAALIMPSVVNVFPKCFSSR